MTRASLVGDGENGSLSTTMVPQYQDDTLLLICFNLVERPETITTHRNISAWIAVLLASIGILGNSFTSFVLIKAQLRSPTDIYMMHLAAFDVAYEIFFAIVTASRTWWPLPLRDSFTFVVIWLLGRPLVDLFSNLATVVVTVFAIDRLLVVYRPLQTLSNSSTNKWLLWIILAIAIILTVPDFFEFSMVDIAPSLLPPDQQNAISPDQLRVPTNETANINNNDSGDLAANNNNDNYMSWTPSGPSCYCFYRTEFAESQFYNAYVYFYAVLFTFIPLILLIFANGFLILGVAKASKKRKSLTIGQLVVVGNPSTAVSGSARGAVARIKSLQNQAADQQRLTLMLVMIVLVFTVCQLPIAIMAIYSLLQEQLPGNFSVLIIYSNILVVVFSTTNFVFYSVFSRRFRQALTAVIRNKNYYYKDTIRRNSVPIIEGGRRPSVVQADIENNPILTEK